MKPKILWEAKKSQKIKSNLFRYEKFLFSKYKLKISQKYYKILKWSIDNPRKFWSSIWDFTKVKGLKSQEYVKSNIFFKTKFLKNSKLNFAENLLSKNDDSKAITFISENGIKKIRNWRELNKNVSKLVTFFKIIKIKEKDRIAAYLPNLIETVESFIATSAIGSIWSSCSPDFGTNGRRRGEFYFCDVGWMGHTGAGTHYSLAWLLDRFVGVLRTPPARLEPPDAQKSAGARTNELSGGFYLGSKMAENASSGHTDPSEASKRGASSGTSRDGRPQPASSSSL